MWTNPRSPAGPLETTRPVPCRDVQRGQRTRVCRVHQRSEGELMTSQAAFLHVCLPLVAVLI